MRNRSSKSDIVLSRCCRWRLIIASVTENGFAVKDEHKMTLSEALRDKDRVEYFEGYANAMLEAVSEDGVPVKGYFGWSESRVTMITCVPSIACRYRSARQF